MRLLLPELLRDLEIMLPGYDDINDCVLEQLEGVIVILLLTREWMLASHVRGKLPRKTSGASFSHEESPKKIQGFIKKEIDRGGWDQNAHYLNLKFCH